MGGEVTTDRKDLRRQRDLAGMSQACVARAVGIDRSTLSLFENGNITLKPEVIVKLRRLYVQEIRRCRDRLEAVLDETVSRHAQEAAATSA